MLHLLLKSGKFYNLFSLKIKKSFILHPFLFAIYPSLFLFSHNLDQGVSYSEIIIPSVIALCFTLLLILLSGFIFKNSNKAGIFVFIILFLFFSYGHVHILTEGWRIGGFLIGRNRYLLLTWGILFICATYSLKKARRNLYKLTNFLNIVALSLIFISLINIGVYEFKIRDSSVNMGRAEFMATSDFNSGESNNLPNIYFIILDSYANLNTLREFLDYDNQQFIHYLTGKGFDVVSESRSNYLYTTYNIASSLNMEYINYLGNSGEIFANKKVYDMTKDNKVMSLFKSQGYKIVHFDSGNTFTKSSKYEDLNINCGSKIGRFQRELWLSTLLRPIFKYFYFFDEGDAERTLCIFSKLAEVQKYIKEPMFVFSHIYAPHTPFVLDSNCNPIENVYIGTPKESSDYAKNISGYVDILTCLNTKVKELVERILSEARVEPIIIIASDHGPALDITKPDLTIATTAEESMKNFAAFYLPNNGNEFLYESITPVNYFRLVFDRYFDTKYGLLDDRSYYSPYNGSHKFTDITQFLRKDSNGIPPGFLDAEQ